MSVSAVGMRKIEWIRPYPSRRPNRVHYMEEDGARTFCKVLNTETSPYLNTPGHVLRETTKPASCKLCLRMVAPQ